MNAPTADQIEAAFAACRSIRFAVKNAARFNGEFSLNDLLSADRLARAALSETDTKAGAAQKTTLKNTSVKKGGRHGR